MRSITNVHQSYHPYCHVGYFNLFRQRPCFLVRDEGKTKRTVKALTWRIALSLLLFLFLLLAFKMGWIQPHAV
ncbi:DUF2909 domain-containing protein [Legionella tunisiensis]|uniref:DUF2909 domain-containing protein n=1 Tax=Legionella tunisiensis TaxID=1034944 RepID=UPI0002F47D05|nr:DUF2909 domain-containing protein [Legionella tunisiensis]